MDVKAIMVNETEKTKKHRKIWFGIIASIILFIVIKHYIGETHVFHEKVKLVGKDVDVKLTYNYVDYWLQLRHVLEVGDNKFTYQYTFNIDGFDYKFEKSRQQIILNEWNGFVYFAGIPYHRHTGKYFFKAYRTKKGTNDWEKISESEYPNEIALRNIWLLSPYNENKRGPRTIRKDSSGFITTIYHKNVIENLNLEGNIADFDGLYSQKIWDALYCNKSDFVYKEASTKEKENYFKWERECWIEFRDKFIRATHSRYHGND